MQMVLLVKIIVMTLVLVFTDTQLCCANKNKNEDVTKFIFNCIISTRIKIEIFYD